LILLEICGKNQRTFYVCRRFINAEVFVIRFLIVEELDAIVGEVVNSGSIDTRIDVDWIPKDICASLFVIHESLREGWSFKSVFIQEVCLLHALLALAK
jgi:hypothetical protein